MNDVYDHHTYDAHIDNWDNEYLYPYKLGNFRKKVLTNPTCIATIEYHLPLELLLQHPQSIELLGNTTNRNSNSNSNNSNNSNNTSNTNNSNTNNSSTTSTSTSTSELDKGLIELNRIPGGFDNTVGMHVVCEGRCDAVAIWVDYQLTSDDIDDGNVLESYGNSGSHSNTNTINNTEQKQDFPLYATQYLKFFSKPADVTTDSIISNNIQFCHGDTDFKYKFTTKI